MSSTSALAKTGAPYRREPTLVVAGRDPLADARTRIAYAIHDGLTQVVTASVLELEWLARRTDAEPGSASVALTAAATHLREALEEIRGLLSGLQPEQGETQPGLDRVIEDLIARWQLPAAWSVEGDLRRVPAETLEVASAVVREGIANAAKHASPTEVRVRVTAAASAVQVRVEDDGAGFSPEGVDARPGHLGLGMIRRRVEDVGGTLELVSEPGRGTRLEARLPLIDREVRP